MVTKKLYKVLIVENNPTEVEDLKMYINRSDDFEVVAVATGAEEALEYIKTTLPDAVIVDLMLNEGSGVKLIHQLREIEKTLASIPYILVTTVLDSSKTSYALHRKLADFIFDKKMQDYGPELILNHLRFMADSFDCNMRKPAPTLNKNVVTKENRIRNKIARELNNYYIGKSSKTREYILDAIYIAATFPKGEEIFTTKHIFPVIGRKYKKEAHTIEKAVTRLIQEAFDKTGAEQLKVNYTPYVNFESGAPSTKEFILYVADKIMQDEDIS